MAIDKPYYPRQWTSPDADCQYGLIQNLDGKGPASCDKIVPTGGDENCNLYKGYYPDANYPTFRPCTNNIIASGCRDALVSPDKCRPIQLKNYVDTDKEFNMNQGWTCEKPPGDKRTALPSKYWPANPKITPDIIGPSTNKEADWNNLCGNSWGNNWAMRCTQKNGAVWPKCQTINVKQNCESTKGCKWYNNKQCVPQTCADMIQNELVCDSTLCDWKSYSPNEYTHGPSGDPPRGYSA